MPSPSVLSFLLVVVCLSARIPLFVQARGGGAGLQISNHNIQTHVQKWMHNRDEAAAKWGHIRTWNTTTVTSLRNLFAFNELFNEDISNWDVSHVTDFSSLFWDATGFNQNVGKWDMSSAMNVACMFCGAIQFNQDITQWDVSKVHDMFSMFNEANNFNQDLSQWNVAHVTNLRETFKDTPGLHQPPLCWTNVNKTARLVAMFNHSSNCFDPTCVENQAMIREAGCSGAWNKNGRGMAWTAVVAVGGVIASLLGVW